MVVERSNSKQKIQTHTTMSTWLKVVLLACIIMYSLGEERHFPEFKQSVEQSSSWKKLSTVNEQRRMILREPQMMNVTIAMKHRNQQWLNDMFHKVSNPDSPLFGKHLTFSQINSMVSPDPNHVQFVLAWIDSYGARVKQISPSSGFITVELHPSVAQEMFGCEISLFQHSETNQRVYRTQGPYSIPKKFEDMISFVGDLVRFPKPSARRKMNAKTSDDDLITPAVIKKFYSISGKPTVAANSSQAIASFLEQYYDDDDLSSFWTQYGISPSDIKTIGPDYQDQPGEEANLDIQYITAIGEGIPTWFVSNPGLHDGQEVFLKWIVNMTNLGDDCPYVHSVSYGDEEASLSYEYTSRVDEEFMKFGIAGRTILFASGDSGAGCDFTSDIDKKFVPNWPASSPFVTTVGGTQTINDEPNGEIAWKGSGGGFSNYFPAPQWQLAAINEYWTQDNLPDRRFFNSTGRGYPDVAALSVDYAIIHRGSINVVDGTSASTPTFAGIISLLNNARFAAGKGPLGFLNYLIYQKWSKVPGAFKDITRGRNPYERCPGFPATHGWDPVTGFGTPNFHILSRLALDE